MLTENMKIWLYNMYMSEAEEHFAVARHEHLCALGSPTNEIALIHEMSADEHRAFALRLVNMAKEFEED